MYSDMTYPQNLVYKITNYTFGKARPYLDKSMTDNLFVDYEFRRKFGCINIENDARWVNVAIEKMPYCLPFFFLENFKDLLLSGKDTLKRYPNFKTFISNLFTVFI